MSTSTTTTTSSASTAALLVEGGSAPTAASVAPPGGGGLGVEDGTTAILTRLKELEASNQQLQRSMEETRRESEYKDERIRELSADKRKDMEQLVDTAIDTWLGSLTEVPEDVRKQFRQGLTKIVEKADMKNAAWEIVCNASRAHSANVHRIEELLKTVSEQGETIKSLVGSESSFSSESARIGGLGSTATNNNNNNHNNNNHNNNNMNKRPRMEGVDGAAAIDALNARNNLHNNNNINTNGSGGKPGDAWDMFGEMLRSQSTSIYY